MEKLYELKEERSRLKGLLKDALANMIKSQADNRKKEDRKVGMVTFVTTSEILNNSIDIIDKKIEDINNEVFYWRNESDFSTVFSEEQLEPEPEADPHPFVLNREIIDAKLEQKKKRREPGCWAEEIAKKTSF